MAPRGRAGFRGGPRGGGRGGGRGRGRGGGARGGRGGLSHPHRGPKFDNARIEYSDSEEEDGSAADNSEADDLDDASSDEDEDEDESKAVAAKPYMALIKSLNEDSSSAAPHAKRRKLDHQSSPDQDQAPEESEKKQQQGDDVDFVEEAEQAPEDADAEGIFDEDDDDEDDKVDTSDPFESHFAAVDEATVTRRLKAIEKQKWSTTKVPGKGTRTILHAPDTGDASDEFAAPAPVSSPTELFLKHKLQESMANKKKLDATEQALAPYLFGYKDLLYCNRNVSTGKSVRRLACLHALNHVFKTRDRVIKNNAKLAAQPEGAAELELRDQGFTRPKVLMILPTREACWRMIETMVSICEPETQENRKRLEDSYHDKQDHFSGDNKPADFKDLFAGNDDDMFRVGVKFTRKTIKYFAQFYNSDILIASPLGLRMAIGSDEGKKIEHDFLSSIEVVIVDQADALLMQNWEHVEYIFDHLNLQPKDDHGCDFSRVRPWYLDDHAKHYRQNLIFTQFHTPELAKLFRLHCRNWAGKARLEQPMPHPGVLSLLNVQAKQTFSRFDASSAESEPDARFAYFTKAVLPTLARQRRDGTLIFIPSYLDFVRVRNFFATNAAAERLTFGTVSEYASIPEASRARAHFFAGRHKVLLYTERAHHFRRYGLKGVQRVVVYGLPDNPVFYQEIVGGNLARAEQDGVVEGGMGSVRVLFSKYDVLKLERIVGSQRVGRMIRERGDTFDFV